MLETTPNPGSAVRCFCAGPPLRVRFAYTALRLGHIEAG
ncbi:hypothetical protein CZ787_06120 [Halomonas citrativorans]|uniref:Uncharacterized protein n=1 Tax=Halomonas citrativorans TaxID=2742612 RepID=A0A1R4HVX9_9GAMM|nr:hypothetical protein CZ787_06120 [Halomonas citrativorans]